MSSNETQTYKFNDENAVPSFKQFSLYGRNHATVNGDITQEVASKIISELKTKLGQTPDTFELKNGSNPATFSQFGLIGKLLAEVNGITTMKAISEAINSQSK